jgi:hypothetical protein
VEMCAALFADTIWFVERLQHEVEAEFLARLGIEAQVRFVEPPRPAGEPPATME